MTLQFQILSNKEAGVFTIMICKNIYNENIDKSQIKGRKNVWRNTQCMHDLPRLTV